MPFRAADVLRRDPDVVRRVLVRAVLPVALAVLLLLPEQQHPGPAGVLPLRHSTPPLPAVPACAPPDGSHADPTQRQRRRRARRYTASTCRDHAGSATVARRRRDGVVGDREVGGHGVLGGTG